MTAAAATLGGGEAVTADDPYRALASIYDEWQDRYGPFWRLVLPRLLRTLDRHPLPDVPPAVVDLGCGTGSLLLALHRRRPPWRLTGVDASAAMLAQAARKRRADQVRWVHASFQSPWFAGEGGACYAAALSFFDAVNHAVPPGALAGLLTTTAAALAPGGLFVFDVNNRDGFEAWWRLRRPYQGPGWTMIMDARFDAASGLAQGSAVVERRGERALTEVTERCFTDDEVAAALAAAGFTVEAREPWRPLPDDVPGKTWCVARRRPA